MMATRQQMVFRKKTQLQHMAGIGVLLRPVVVTLGSIVSTVVLRAETVRVVLIECGLSELFEFHKSAPRIATTAILWGSCYKIDSHVITKNLSGCQRMLPSAPIRQHLCRSPGIF